MSEWITHYDIRDDRVYSIDTSLLIEVHPWKDDLKSMAKMLAGEIELPHIKLVTGFDGLNRPIATYMNHGCVDCHEAFNLRYKYQQQLLSEEIRVSWDS